MSLMLLSILLSLGFAQAQPNQPKVGVDIPLRWESGESLRFPLQLEAGNRVEGGVWQQSINVTMSILDDKDIPMETFDYFHRDVDPIRWEAPLSGNYTLEIRPKEKGRAGRAVLRLGLLGPLGKNRDVIAQQYLNNYLDGIQGIQTAVIQKGELLLAEARGAANLEYGIPMTLDTPCRADVLLRQMTEVGILRLLDAGMLTLDTPIEEVLHDFPAQSPPLLIRHLLRKESGLSHPHILWELATGDSRYCPKETQQYALYREGMSNVFEPGTDEDWSDISGLLCRRILDQKSRQGLSNWFETSLFEALSMNDTSFVYANAEVLGRAKTYRWSTSGNLLPAREVKAEPTMFTTMNDWIRWQAYLTHSEEGRPSFWSRLREIESMGSRTGLRGQSGFLYEEQNEVWCLELTNSTTDLYPQWASEVLMPLFSTEVGWPMKHPGTTMGRGGRGGRGKSLYQASRQLRQQWSGQYREVNLGTIYHMEDLGGSLELRTPSGSLGPVEFGSAEMAYVKFLDITLREPVLDSLGQVQSFLVRHRGIGDLAFERITKPDESF